MKKPLHPNIVNFLESYLVKTNDLWVAVGFMEGDALTEIIEHNTMEKDKISCILFEVGAWR
jgi:serine/threonine protein kinase